MIYLPGFPGNTKDDFLFSMINDLNIPIINIKEEIFDKHPDKLSLFPFRKPGHYTPEAYKLIAKLIIDLID